VHRKLKFSLKIAQLIALLVSLTCTILAQQQIETPAAPYNASAFRVGEHLSYNVSFAQFVSAAHVDLFVAARGTFFDRDAIQLRSHVETTGVVNVALVAINNDYTTYIDPATGLPFRVQEVVRQAGRTSEASADYNQPAGTDAIPPKLRTSFPGTFDLLSALYRLRAMPLANRDVYSITVREGGMEYPATIKVTGRETIKTNVGSFSTIVVSAVEKPSPFYNIRVHFSDDQWHVPVLVTLDSPSGPIRAELAASELLAPRTAPGTKPTNVSPDRIMPADPPLASDPPGRSGQPNVKPPAETLDTPSDLPFKVGEQLNYQVYLGPSTQSVGSITLTVRARGRYFNRDGLFLSASAQSTGAGARIFAVSDRINSYVAPNTLLPFRSELSLSEGRHRTNLNYNLDQDRGSAIAEGRDRIDIPVGTHDLISLVYAIRTFDLAPPKRNAISILATSRPRTLFITSLRRETIQVGTQKIPAILLSLTTDDPQSDRMQLRMWIGDDSRHLPLRITGMTEFGIARADLAIAPVTSQ
jgi:hypothetical protein